MTLNDSANHPNDSKSRILFDPITGKPVAVTIQMATYDALYDAFFRSLSKNKKVKSVVEDDLDIIQREYCRCYLRKIAESFRYVS